MVNLGDSEAKNDSPALGKSMGKGFFFFFGRKTEVQF